MAEQQKYYVLYKGEGYGTYGDDKEAILITMKLKRENKDTMYGFSIVRGTLEIGDNESLLPQTNLVPIAEFDGDGNRKT